MPILFLTHSQCLVVAASSCDIMQPLKMIHIEFLIIVSGNFMYYND